MKLGQITSKRVLKEKINTINIEDASKIVERTLNLYGKEVFGFQVSFSNGKRSSYVSINLFVFYTLFLFSYSVTFLFSFYIGSNYFPFLYHATSSFTPIELI